MDRVETVGQVLAHQRSDVGAAPAGPGRLPALDGLRGLAALVVVLHHVLLLSPGLVRQHGISRGGSPEGGQPWWLAQTPLHLTWAGTEAVYVFFVLSGYVLVRPFLSGRSSARRVSTWLGYYPQRLVRLYVPVAGATALTLALVLAFPRVDRPELSWWYASHQGDVHLRQIVKMLVLVQGPTRLNSPFWSLQWEVLFSLLLPVFVLVALVARRWAWGVGLAAVALVGLGAVQTSADGGALLYLPMFAVGAVLAACEAHLRAWSADRSGVFWAAWAAVAAVILLPAWWWPAVLGLRGLSFAGALMIMIAFLGCPAATWLGTRRWVQWLGATSFSLYLLHEPIVVSVATLVHTGSSWGDVALVLALGVPVSLVVAALFHRFVERPSLVLSRAVGKAARARATRGSESVGR